VRAGADVYGVDVACPRVRGEEGGAAQRCRPVDLCVWGVSLRALTLAVVVPQRRSTALGYVEDGIGGGEGVE
jgi:hypothetical protein